VALIPLDTSRRSNYSGSEQGTIPRVARLVGAINISQFENWQLELMKGEAHVCPRVWERYPESIEVDQWISKFD
jgi:hypothetical protein